MKNNQLTTTLLLISISLYSQIIKPTRYNLDSLHRPTIKEDYKFIRVVENYKNEPNLFIFTEYYRSGKISMKAISSKADKPSFQGPRIDYYENGNKKQESNYIDNNLNGKLLEWYDNGEMKSEKEITWDAGNKNSIIKIVQFWNKEKQQTVIDGNGQYEESDEKIHEKGPIKLGEKEGVWEGKDLKENYTFSEIYRDGKFISGISADEKSNKYPYKQFSEKAIPQRGIKDFYQYVARNYKTPNIQGLQGKVYITFVIDKDGKLTQFKILRDLGYGTGQEAIRVLQKAEKWIPGKTRGIASKTSFSLPISITSSGASNFNNQEPTFESEMLRNTNPNW